MPVSSVETGNRRTYLLMILLVALSESANREGQELHKLLQESCSVLLLKEGHDLTLDYLLTLE